MNLTGQELVDLGIVTGLTEPQKNINIQQHGVDLNLIKVQRVTGVGFVPADEYKVALDESVSLVARKTKLAGRTDMPPMKQLVEEEGRWVEVWILQPGAYDFTFQQGCVIPPNQRGQIVQRSSMKRNGAFVRSPMFDAGFETNSMGTVFILVNPLVIEVGARVAQFITETSNVVKNLYNGQWQNDKQRVEEKKN